VVFFCFLYQLWIYPVDNTRVNEYGLTGEDFMEGSGIAKKDGHEQANQSCEDGGKFKTLIRSVLAEQWMEYVSSRPLY
jgi:hypothetical protein